MAEEGKGFTVRDRRFSSEEGAGAESATEEKKKPTEEEAAAAEERSTERTSAEDLESSGSADAPLPEVNFPTFILSLNASALVHLGAIEDPAAGKKIKNLPMAKQTIDILSMLEEKTRGNLARDEENMLKNILYDLRILYVKER
jgi:hypothetical protein